MLSQPIVDVLVALATSGTKDFNKVAGAANFTVAQEDLILPPAAYVIPLSDSATPNLIGFGGIEQHVVERFGVILAVENSRDVRGDAVNSALEILRSKTIAALLGFQVAVDYDPVQYGGGRILALDVSTTWWQLEFITGYYERKV